MIFVSEPLLTFFPETKSGCFLSPRVNIRIVNDRMFVFYYVIPYGSIWKIQRNDSKCIFGTICVGEIGSYDQDQLNTPAICLWCLGTWWFLFGGGDLRNATTEVGPFQASGQSKLRSSQPAGLNGLRWVKLGSVCQDIPKNPGHCE